MGGTMMILKTISYAWLIRGINIEEEQEYEVATSVRYLGASVLTVLISVDILPGKLADIGSAIKEWVMYKRPSSCNKL